MRATTFGALGTIFDGPHATPTRTDVGPYFLNVASLVEGRLDLSESDHVGEADFETWTRRVVPQEGDLLFSYETRLGDAALMPADLQACLGRRMALLRPDPSAVDPRFVLYYYLSPEFQRTIAQRTVHGATVNRIPLSSMATWPVSLPEIDEQQAIAQVLGALDDKIAANDRILGVSDSWTRAEYERVTSEDVRVPLARLIDDVRELVEPSSVDPSTLYIGLEHVPRRRMWLSDSGVAQDVSSAKVRFALGDVLFGKLPPYFHKVVAAPGPGIFSSDILVCRPKSSRFAGLTLAALASDFVISVCAAVSTGTRMPRTSARNLADIEVPWTENEMGAADASAAIASLRDHAIRAENESHVLAALRDTLLPQLMSGRFRVKDAEQQVEAVV